MGNEKFRESRLKKARGGTGFLKVFLLTVIIVSAAFLIDLTVPSAKAEETTSETPQATSQSQPTVTSSDSQTNPETTEGSTQTVQTTTDLISDTTTTAKTSQQTISETTTSVESPSISDEEMNKLIEIKYLVVNPYSRVGEKRKSTDFIVVHYVANPGTCAINNWGYFNGLASQKSSKTATSASSNFIIGLDGEIIQCMPIDEIAYANYPKNEVSISIECCHPTSDGKFNEATYNSLVKLVSWLCEKYGLGKPDVIRHYDVSGKLCPLYWAGEPGSVEYDRWTAFKEDLLID